MTTPTQMPESLKVPEELAAIQQALDEGPTPGPWSAVVQADWPHPQDVYITAERWGAVARSRIDPSLPNVEIQRANLRLLAASGPTTWTAVLAHISALQSALKDRDAEIERLKKDAERLDWLDSLNQRLNAHYQTSYQWKLVLSPNVVRLMSGRFDIDLHDSDAKGVASCRAAIDSMKGDANG